VSGLSLQHSLLSDFAAGCSAATAVGCGAAIIATFMGADLGEPLQHELDMIDLHI